MLFQPSLQPCNLINAGDGAVGDFDELGINFRARRLSNPPRRFSKFPVDTEAALIDRAAEHPQRLFRS